MPGEKPAGRTRHVGLSLRGPQRLTWWAPKEAAALAKPTFHIIQPREATGPLGPGDFSS